jgi:pSer/pThr/pTyr-binding forkhead associated (FHA) protein
LENHRFSLSDQLRLGSEADNDLTLLDKKASLHHAIIQRQGVVYKITDLNSDSGTYVNGKRITGPTLLKNGDIVLIGDTQLTISDQP